jgi:hypothetical protein
MLLFMTCAVLLAIPAIALASDVNVAVVDVDVAPANSADLKPGGTSNLEYTLTVSGAQAGTATFEIYKNWTLKDGVFTGSNPEEFTVGPRAGGAPPTVITRTGTLTVDSTQADVLGKQLTVGVFDITNTNATGAKLAAGTSGTYTVNVDGTKPTITLTSPEDGKTYLVGSSLTASFTCQDTGGSGIKTTGGCVGTQDNGTTISTSTAGARTFTVTATDKAGNVETVTHNYSVGNPNTEPELTLPGNQTVEATGPSGAAFDFASLVRASDDEDGDLTSAVECTPASGSTFDFGTTTVECSVEDSGGLTDSDSFDVTVVDTTAPDLTVPAEITDVEATGPGGAAVDFSGEVSASDLVDGEVAVECDPPSGSTFELGTTTVNCSATDTRGNTAQDSFDVTVVDTTGPALTLPANITTTAPSNSAATVTYTATATDLVDGSRPVNCTPPSGSSFPAGTTTVTCSSSDTRGNTSNGSFTVTVNYNWTGFFQPIDKDVPNKAKAGSVVPVKFSLGGDQGLNIFYTGDLAKVYPRVAGATGCTGTVGDLVEEYAPANASGLKYDATANQYIYNWKTQSNYAGKCLQLEVKLADGSSHTALFTFFK